MPVALDPVEERRHRRAFGVFFALVALFLLGAGVRQLVFTLSGPTATATVERCEPYIVNDHADTHCTGSWTVGGRAMNGTIVGVDYGDVGKTVGVHVHRDAAYSPSLLPPVVLLALGVVLAGVTVLAFRRPATASYAR